MRVATFNVSLARSEPGALRRALEHGDAQAHGAAALIRIVRPDIILLNEFDVDLTGETLQVFATHYLEQPRADGLTPLTFPFRWVANSNTGIPSGFDLNRDGLVGGPAGSRAYAEDALGFGTFEGQYGFAVLSRYPINMAKTRTFQHFRWKDMPGALLPSDPDTGGEHGWYSKEALEVLRLSSKNHADVLIEVSPGVELHFLVSHPTPPAIEGAERRNTLRNHDEIRFWLEYLDDRDWIVDDAGRRGGLPHGAHFVVAGDLNSDPCDPPDDMHSIRMLLGHPKVAHEPVPGSKGGVEASLRMGGRNSVRRGNPAFDTASFHPATVGNLRVDYVLPSTLLEITGSGVFWPLQSEEGFAFVGDYPFPVSDHRLVWVDIAWEKEYKR